MTRTKSLLTWGITLIASAALAASTQAQALPLGGAFENLGDANDATMQAKAQREADLERTVYKSPERETQTFEGIFFPLSDKTQLAVLSDDGVTIAINDQITNVVNATVGQHGPDLNQSLKRLNNTFKKGQPYRIQITYTNTIYNGDNDLDGVTLFAYNGGGRVQEVNLIIADGQTGRNVPDDDEETVGAFTVANQNDTDSDTTVDNSDNNVPGEKDLMALQISRPSGPITDTLSVKITSGTARLWQSDAKGTPVPLTNGAAVFALQDLPKKIYLEATVTSQNLRDVTVTLDYKGKTDTVKATGVWATMTAVERTNREVADILADPIWTDTTIPPANQVQRFGGTGLRPLSNAGIFNAILFQFTLYPKGIGQEKDVAFDVTRQVGNRVFVKDADTPWSELVEARVEAPTSGDAANDDQSNADESATPTQADHFYSYDAPGINTPTPISDVLVYRLSGFEFVRVRFDGTRPSGNTDDGSRCSPKTAWHAQHKLIGAFTPTWRRSTGDDAQTEDNDVKLGAINVDAPLG